VTLHSIVGNDEMLLTFVIGIPGLRVLFVLHVAFYIIKLNVTAPISGGLGCAGAVGVFARLAEEKANCANSGTTGHKDTNSRFGDAPIHRNTHGHGDIRIYYEGRDETQANGRSNDSTMYVISQIASRC
jgi:hypothetical protein